MIGWIHTYWRARLTRDFPDQVAVMSDDELLWTHGYYDHGKGASRPEWLRRRWLEATDAEIARRFGHDRLRPTGALPWERAA